MNDMSFPRSNEDTRKYYFPYDNSFVVSEIVTETGVYVVGAVGKGQASGYDYQLFAYQSKLDIDDFLEEKGSTEEKKVRNYNELVSHLAKRGIWVKSLQPKQMRDALMGKTITLKNDEKFSIGIFRLRSMTDANYRLFIRVFKNLLHMNNINLDEIKRLLIDVLLPGEGSTSVDFMARYRILNEEVESAKAKVDTAVKIAADVKKLSEAKELRDGAYGILRALFSSITTDYEAERDRREKEIKNIVDEIESIEPRIQKLKDSQGPRQSENQSLAIKESELNKKLAEINEGDARFTLFGDAEDITSQIDEMQSEVERMVGELQRTHPGDTQGIMSELKSVNQTINELSARLDAINNNLLFVLSERFGESQVQVIAKLLNRDLLSALPIGDDDVSILDENKLFEVISNALSHCSGGYYDDGHIRVNLDKIESIDIDDYFNYDTIKESLERQQKRKSDLERDLEVARDYKELEQKKNDLHSKIIKERETLKEYQAYLQAKKERPTLEGQLKEICQSLDAGKKELKNITDKLLGLGEKKQTLITDKARKETGLASLQSKYEKVVPISSVEPTGIKPSHRLPTALEDMIDTYLLALDERQKSREQIDHRLAIIESKNGLRFTSGQDEDTTIRELLDAVEGTDEYLKQQTNCEKAVSQEIGALLKGLSDRLATFELGIKQFNRKMNSRKISNIKRIEFVIDGDNDILRTVKEIVEQDSIFSNPESVHRAVRHLDEIISKRGVKLCLESLFNMGIEVELESGKVVSSFNDSNIESTGTGLTVKVILNVMLLNRLLFIKEGQVVNIPIYIDEAGQIDPSNQQTLIEQCLPAGFVPVFASVEAQATAEYWIGLNEVGGRIYVDQKDWYRLSVVDEPQEGVKESSSA